eukprot:5004542-Pyramimonas_sp.AAC.1
MVFAKFDSMSARDKYVSILGRAQLKHQENMIWTRPDQPLEKRVPESFLFGLRKTFLGWGYSKSEVRVDTVEQKLKVAK